MDIQIKKDFIYLLNKCSMLYIHLDKDIKKDVLYNIKDFILTLQETFDNNNDLKNLNIEDKKEKILSTLIPYLDKLTTHFMIKHISIDENKKEFLIKEIDISSLSYARKLINETHNNQINHNNNSDNNNSDNNNFDNNNFDNNNADNNNSDNNNDNTNNNDNNILEVKKCEIKESKGKESMDIKKYYFQEQINKVTDKITNHIDDKMISLHEELNTFFKKKFDLLNEENKELFKNSNKDFHQHIQNQFENHKNESSSYLTYVSQKIYQEIEKKLFELEKNNKELTTSYIDSNYNKIRDEIRDKIMYDLENQIKNEIYSKIDKLTHILNKNLESSLKNATHLNNEEIKEFMNKKIEEYEYLIKNTPYILHYDKVSNMISLTNNEEVLSSISLPLIQGPKGDRGPQGERGERGSIPLFKNIDVTKDGYISVIVQDENRSYELKSANKINIPVQTIPVQTMPLQHQPMVGKEKEIINVTKVIHDLHFDKSHVMRLDSNNDHNLIILKSLSIGENSHCIRPNSLSIGGATTFQEHSLAIGQKSQTLSKNSIALFGSTSGENAFAYNAQNVPSNQFIIGSNNDNIYNIQKINLNAEYIHLNSKNISISAYDEKIKALENKISYLEKHIVHVKNNKEENHSSGFTSIFPSAFVQDKFF